MTGKLSKAEAMTQQAVAEAMAQTIRISRGRHQPTSAKACVMEVASMLAGEPFSDRPRAVCPVIGAYLRTVNDLLDGWDRQRLRPYAARVVGTVGGWSSRHDRALLCAQYAASARRRRAWRSPVLRSVRWGPIAAEAALGRGGVDAAMSLCDLLITTGPHRPDPDIPTFRPTDTACSGGGDVMVASVRL